MSIPSDAEFPDAVWEWWQRVRNKSPLVHCITNFVSMDIMANTLLAAGCAPAMMHAEDESLEFIRNASSALLVNIGTRDPDWQKSMLASTKQAKEVGVPWVLDPVAAGATTARTAFSQELLKFSPTVIRGNPSEIHCLAGNLGTSKGVDSTLESDQALISAKKLAKAIGSIVAVSGADDYATDGKHTIKISNGVPLMQAITASGCSLSALIAGFTSVDKASPLLAAAYTLAVYSVIGELAFDSIEIKGPGSLRSRMLDLLHCVKKEDFVKRVKMTKIE